MRRLGFRPARNGPGARLTETYIVLTLTLRFRIAMLFFDIRVAIEPVSMHMGLSLVMRIIPRLESGVMILCNFHELEASACGVM